MTVFNDPTDAHVPLCCTAIAVPVGAASVHAKTSQQSVGRRINQTSCHMRSYVGKLISDRRLHVACVLMEHVSWLMASDRVSPALRWHCKRADGPGRLLRRTGCDVPPLQQGAEWLHMDSHNA